MRLRDGDVWENIPEDLLIDLAQLTKANSIEGKFFREYYRYLIPSPPLLGLRSKQAWEVDCAKKGNKKDNITVIYTPWSNLRKDGSMAAGQVSFKDEKKVKRIHVAQRENVIINRLNKTKVEKHPDLKQEKEDRQRDLRKLDQADQQKRVRISRSFPASPRTNSPPTPSPPSKIIP